MRLLAANWELATLTLFLVEEFSQWDIGFMDDKHTPQTWQELLGQIIENPQVKQRIARDTRVKPITLTRWAHNIAKPRDDNMRLLLRALPREEFMLFSR